MKQLIFLQYVSLYYGKVVSGNVASTYTPPYCTLINADIFRLSTDSIEQREPILKKLRCGNHRQIINHDVNIFANFCNKNSNLVEIITLD